MSKYRNMKTERIQEEKIIFSKMYTPKNVKRSFEQQRGQLNSFEKKKGAKKSSIVQEMHGMIKLPKRNLRFSIFAHPQIHSIFKIERAENEKT